MKNNEDNKLSNLEKVELLRKHNDRFREYLDGLEVHMYADLVKSVDRSLKSDGLSSGYVDIADQLRVDDRSDDDLVVVNADGLVQGVDDFAAGEYLDDYFQTTPSYDVDDMLAEAQEQEHKRSQVKA